MDQQIFWFNISMNNITSVAVCNTFDHLIDKESQSFWIYACCIFFKDFKQILFNILKYQV